MRNCFQCKALFGAESQVLRHGKTVTDLIKLLQNVREDGGLGEAQCQTMDKLVARNEAIVAGIFDSCDTLSETKLVYREILKECGVESIQTVIDGFHLLREIAIESGPITDTDMETFQPEDRVCLEPTFDLICRIATIFGDDGQCACCGPMESKPLAIAFDPGQEGGDRTVKFHLIQEDVWETITQALFYGLAAESERHKQNALEQALQLLAPDRTSGSVDAKVGG